MIDERWSADVADVIAALRGLLADVSSETAVRAAEASAHGWLPEVDSTLRDFGLYELPGDAELLAAVAIEIGRALAPVPWPEVAAVSTVLGTEDVAYALHVAAPVGPSRALVRAGEGAAIVSNVGRERRTGAGDLLVERPPEEVAPSYGQVQTSRVECLMRLLAAGRIVGASAALLEIGVRYAKERHAFGKPIGSYQAVAHQLVDAAIAVEGAELLVKKTAYVTNALDEGCAPPPLFGSMVWATAIDAGRIVARHVHQCMGGFGATLEYPAQLYSRRIRSWALRLDRPVDSYREIARQVLDAGGREAIVGLWHHDRGVSVPRWVRELDQVSGRTK